MGRREGEVGDSDFMAEVHAFKKQVAKVVMWEGLDVVVCTRGLWRERGLG